MNRGPITLAEHDRLPEAAAPSDCADCLLDAKEVAELLGVHPNWVYLNYRQLPHIPFGTGSKPRIRFRRKAILAWIEQHEIDWRKKR